MDWRVMMKKVNSKLAIGFILLSISVPLLFFIMEEVGYLIYSANHYKYEDYTSEHSKPYIFNYSQGIEYKGHDIQITDDFKDFLKGEQPYNYEDKREMGRVKIMINGHDVSSNSLVEIRPYQDNNNRYWRWIEVFRVINRWTQTEELAIVQREQADQIPLTFPTYRDRMELKWRILYVHPDGKVQEDIFNDNKRTSTLLRANLTGLMSPNGVSYATDILNYSIMLFIFPFVHPLLTCIVGYRFYKRGIQIYKTNRALLDKEASPILGEQAVLNKKQRFTKYMLHNLFGPLGMIVMGIVIVEVVLDFLRYGKVRFLGYDIILLVYFGSWFLSSYLQLRKSRESLDWENFWSGFVLTTITLFGYIFYYLVTLSAFPI
jgi:hypothetical protein